MVNSEAKNEWADFPFTSEEGQAALILGSLIHRYNDNFFIFQLRRLCSSSVLEIERDRDPELLCRASEF